VCHTAELVASSGASRLCQVECQAVPRCDQAAIAHCIAHSGWQGPFACPETEAAMGPDGGPMDHLLLRPGVRGRRKPRGRSRASP
jgi:hypothetical protein